MGKCINHPDVETRFICQKHNYYVCEKCMTCKDPKLYCKYKTACPIRFMEKNDMDEDKTKIK